METIWRFKKKPRVKTGYPGASDCVTPINIGLGDVIYFGFETRERGRWRCNFHEHVHNWSNIMGVDTAQIGAKWIWKPESTFENILVACLSCAGDMVVRFWLEWNWSQHNWRRLCTTSQKYKLRNSPLSEKENDNWSNTGYPIKLQKHIIWGQGLILRRDHYLRYQLIL